MFKRKAKPQSFCASTILGAKSIALQKGIPPTRTPDFQHYSGGQWTLIYGG